MTAALLATIFGAFPDAVCAEPGTALTPPGATLRDSRLDESLRLEAQGAIRRAGRYLCARQLPDGSWAEHPAVTSLCALALLNAAPEPPADFREHAARGVQFIVTRLAGEDRTEFAGGQQYPVFTVAVAMLAVIRLQEPADSAFLLEARRFLLGAQCREVLETDPTYGGFRSGKGHRPDLTTTEYVLEALYLSDALDRAPAAADPEAGRRADAAYAAALVFVSRCQAVEPVGPAPAAGSFHDSPGDSTGKPLPATPRSVGYLTCAGLKSLLYAGVKADDPRVRAALGWLQKSFTVERNPGLGDAGYYTYIFTLTKALNAWERDAQAQVDPGFTSVAEKSPGGRPFDRLRVPSQVEGLASAAAAVGADRLPSVTIPSPTSKSYEPFRPTWRREVTAALLARQAGAGEWTHRAPDWWENRPELTTAYAMLALELALRE